MMLIYSFVKILVLVYANRNQQRALWINQ